MLLVKMKYKLKKMYSNSKYNKYIISIPFDSLLRLKAISSHGLNIIKRDSACQHAGSQERNFNKI